MNLLNRVVGLLTCLTFVWSNLYPSIAQAQTALISSRVPTVNQMMVGPRDIRPSLDNSLQNLNNLPLVEQNGFASKSLARFWQSRSLLGVHSGSFSRFNETAVMNDKLNRVASETQKFGTLSFAVTSVYDKAGNRTKVTYPSTKNAEYVYNALIRSPTLRSIRLPWLITRTMF